jgi:hypothetical protein
MKEYVTVEVKGVKVKVDTEIIDVRNAVKVMIEDVLYQDDFAWHEYIADVDDWVEKVAALVMIVEAKVTAVDESDGMYVLDNEFDMVVDGKRWHVYVHEGPAAEWLIDNAGFLEHVEFIEWVRRKRDETGK